MVKRIAYRMVVPAGLRPDASRRARMFYLAMAQVAGAISMYRWYRIKQLEQENAQLRTQHQNTLEVLLRDRTEDEVLEF